MPISYVSKLARKHGTTTRRAEGKWAKAKAAASAAGHNDNYAVVTSIFKKMMHETPYIPTLKDLTRGMSFKYFLVAEDDVSQQPTKERSQAWKHLEKFPQFNELPFKVRRDLEREVQADGLIDDYEQLEPEEKESIDDHLQDLIIDHMQKHFGKGINVGDWASTDHSNDPNPAEFEDALNDLPDEGGEPIPRKRKERAPSHIAAMRGPHDTETTGEEPVSGGLPSVGTKKTYYKPWSALSDEQRAGRAKLAQRHGLLYRTKNSKWFRTLPPDKQQSIIDMLKSGNSLEQARKLLA